MEKSMDLRTLISEFSTLSMIFKFNTFLIVFDKVLG